MNFITLTAMVLVLIVSVHLFSDRESNSKGGLVVAIAVAVLLFTIVGWSQVSQFVTVITLALHR